MNDEKRIIKIGPHYINVDAIVHVKVHKKYVTVHMINSSAMIMLKEPQAGQFIRWLDQHTERI